MISMKDIEPVGGPLRPCGPPPAPVVAAMRASRVADRAWQAAGTCHCSESSQQAWCPWWRGHYRKQSSGTDLSGEGGGDNPPSVDLSAPHPHDTHQKYEHRSVCCSSQRHSVLCGLLLTTPVSDCERVSREECSPWKGDCETQNTSNEAPASGKLALLHLCPIIISFQRVSRYLEPGRV